MFEENENIVYKNIGGVEIIQFKKLMQYSDNIEHEYCIGIDRNFRTSRADNVRLTDEEYNKAVSDYKDLCSAVNLNYNDIVKTKQSHTDNVQIVESKDVEEADFDTYEDTDGFITNKSNLILSTTNADCILLLFYDPVKNIIANVHSGWKGTLQRISVKAIRKMKQEYGCNEKDIIVCMCPSIRKCHFEVDQDVYDMFLNEFNDLNNERYIHENTRKMAY